MRVESSHNDEKDINNYYDGWWKKKQKQQCCSLCFGAARLCLNLHYFVYFVTDYIDGIVLYLMRGEKASKSIIFCKITKIVCVL